MIKFQHELNRITQEFKNEKDDLINKLEKFEKEKDQAFRTCTTFMNELNDGVVIMRTDSKVISYNPKAHSLFKEFTCNLGESDCLNNEVFFRESGLKEQYDKCLTIKEETLGKIHKRNKNKNIFIRYKFIPVIGNKNEITRLILKMDDSKYQPKSKITNENDSDPDFLISCFLSNINHEIRTPLNGIVGFASLLKRNHLNEQKRNEYLDIIDNKSKELLRIIDNILDISKIDINLLKLEPKEFNLNQLFAGIYLKIKDIIQNEHKETVKLKTRDDIFSKPFWIESDELRLKQILTNLLDNAVKFTHQGYINMDYQVIANNFILFKIEDSGVGISDDKLEQIFKRFRQSDEGPNREFGGNGLGLTITKSLVDLMKGEIWVESEKYKGSCFYVKIPYKDCKEKNKMVMEYNAMNNLDKDKISILIVEDDESSSYLLSEIVKELNARVYVAKSGKEALEILKKVKHFDVVLMDLQLPDIDGFEITRLIKAVDRQIQVIAQTAFTMDEDKIKAFNAGCDGFIKKPIRKNELLEKIGEIIQQRNENKG